MSKYDFSILLYFRFHALDFEQKIGIFDNGEQNTAKLPYVSFLNLSASIVKLTSYLPLLNEFVPKLLEIRHLSKLLVKITKT